MFSIQFAGVKMVTETEIVAYVKSLLELSADEFTAELEKLCPECLYLLCTYLIKNPCEFEGSRISIPLCKYALFYINYCDMNE
jgi:hypothetical protein